MPLLITKFGFKKWIRTCIKFSYLKSSTLRQQFLQSKQMRCSYMPGLVSNFCTIHVLALNHLSMSNLPSLLESATPFPHGVYDPEASSTRFVFKWPLLTSPHQIIDRTTLRISMQQLEKMLDKLQRSHCSSFSDILCLRRNGKNLSSIKIWLLYPSHSVPSSTRNICPLCTSNLATCISTIGRRKFRSQTSTYGQM